MIYRLRKKFIIITAVSVGIVFAMVFGGICFISYLQLNHSMDMLTDIIGMNDGDFPNFNNSGSSAQADNSPQNQFITPELQFSTRFFTVWIDDENNILRENMEHISSVSKEEVKNYTEDALNKKTERGWVNNYRYRISETEYGQLMVFVNGETNKEMTLRLIYAIFFVLSGSFALILLLILFISKKAVKPIAESYEKQKQFITDANHELKTPLTLILSNIDIIESEIGKNEWLDDIRSEGERMSSLIHQLVFLSRMDEDHSNLNLTYFDLSETVSDTVSEFIGLADENGKNMVVNIRPSIWYHGDESLIRRLICILLDNSIKYCDSNGKIKVELYVRGKASIITVENSYKNVENENLEKFFDRFYRADKARTYTGSFGIGLSIAKGIAKNHNGDIIVYKKDSQNIEFIVTLK